MELSFSGMHKKSLEAADALKSSDEDGEGDAERTETSGASSPKDQRKSPTTTPSSTSESTPSKKPKSIANGSPASSSMSPITVSSPIHHSPAVTPKSPKEEPRPKESCVVSAPAPRQSSYHMNSLESALSQQHPSILHSSHPGHPYPPMNPINTAPDTDPSEVFRWVNFNREYSSSFIRWICALIIFFSFKMFMNRIIYKQAKSWMFRVHHWLIIVFHLFTSEITQLHAYVRRLKSIKQD